MYSDRYLRQLLSYQKLALENWQDSAAFAQALSFDTGMKVLDSSEWFPKENKTNAKTFQTYATQALKRLNKYLDDSFSLYEKLMSPPGSKTPPKQKTSKPRAEGK